MLIDAMETAAFFCHIHPHARIKAIKKLLTNTAHFFERSAPEESFGLHNQTTTHPIRLYLEEIIERGFLVHNVVQEALITVHKISRMATASISRTLCQL